MDSAASRNIPHNNRRNIHVGELQLHSLYKHFKLLFLLYICVSLVYTLFHFYTLFKNSSSTYTTPSGSMGQQHSIIGKILLDNSHSTNYNIKSVLSGKLSVQSIDEQQKHENPFYGISESILYSKMFQYALQPTNIIPFFYRMSSIPSDNDITITTMITIERLDVFINLVNKYRGPISLTLHINDDDSKVDAIERLFQVYNSNAYFAKYVDLHLVVDKHDRQFNLWRNVARFFARTDFIMAIDVDFMLCSDLKENFLRLPIEYKEMLRNGSSVFVIPAFEFARKAAEVDVSKYPSRKTELMDYILNDEILMFHNSWKRGHGPTDYKKWYDASMPYKVEEYNYNYEPYILMKKDGHPWCDERFVGYGANKAACLYEIFLSGAQFWVLPDDFLIHQRHPYPENDRRVERKYNKRLYDAYREETCFRYARMSQGIQNTSAVDERICGANLPTFYGL